MVKISKEEKWELYKKTTLHNVSPTLSSLGFILDEVQPHIIGERYLMQAVTTSGGKKLILLGVRKEDGLRVVIKVTNDKSGKKELKDEQSHRRLLNKIDFAASAFRSPKEIMLEERDGYLFSIQEFIEQESTFLERPTEEQFFFALNAFKAQEGAHAATYGHLRTIKKAYSVFTSESYIANFLNFREGEYKSELSSAFDESMDLLREKRETIDQYCGFLVHTDFVPHNIRIRGGKLYLLDHSSLRFGNKYEGWARFLNFMALYNPKLEKALVDYVHNNRTKEEHLSLKLMRIYRLGEIISYYQDKLSKSEGDLLKLNKVRVVFWGNVLKAILNDEFVDNTLIEEYKKIRDELRSPEENIRQKDLH